MSLFDHLGRALRWMRENRGLRQYEVAEAAGITKAMLSAYETGKQKPSLDTLEKILEALDYGLPDLDEALAIFAISGPARPAPRQPPVRPVGRGAGPPAAGDVEQLLGIKRQLASAEKEALTEVMDGFHKLVRYLHDKMSGSNDREPEDRSEDDET